VTGNGGAKVAQHTYRAFGSEITPANQDAERMKFTSQERDFANGSTTDPLDYMHARYYNPTLGRFLSVDPIMPIDAMRSPQLWNRYSYVGNNPMNRIDPTGKILQFAGSAEDLEKLKQIANSGLHGYKLNINDQGVTSLQKVKVAGKETSEQKAFREGLQKVIGDKATTSINVASGARGVVIGQFNMRTIDPTDMQKFGSAQPSAASTLGHEVMEQYAGQVLGMTNVVAAHTWAISQENLFTGWTRGGQTPTKWLPNGQAYGDVRYTRGNEAMDVRVMVDPRTFDVTSVARIPVP
jgi:RHS repeat-associated protein